MADGKLSGIIQKITANIIGEGNPYTAKKCTQTAFDKTIDREIANYEEKSHTPIIRTVATMHPVFRLPDPER